MKQNFLVGFIFCILSISSVFANDVDQSKEVFTLRGEEFVEYELVNFEDVTRYREEEVDSTCTRQIPYTENVCGYETQYRRECRTENERVCRNVRRTRTECSNTGSRTECRNVNGRRICRQVPGRRVCREVPYYDRVCHYEPRTVCDNVPYQEYVCRDVTRYREEQYPCTRTVRIPYQVKVKRIAEINFDFWGNNLQTSIEFSIKLLPNGEVELKAKDNSPRPYVITVKKDLDVRESDLEVTYVINYTVKLMKAKNVFSPVKREISDLVLYKKKLQFNIGAIKKEQLFSIRVKIDKVGGKVKLDKVFNANELSAATVNDGVDRLTFDLAALGVKISKRKEYDITITPSVHLDRLEAEVINAEDFQTRSTFSRRFSVTK